MFCFTACTNYNGVLANMTENNQTGFLPNQTVMEGDKTNFEAIIMKRFGGEASQIVLQDLIQASKIPDRFKSVQKPRKFFAAKMFLTALSKSFFLN